MPICSFCREDIKKGTGKLFVYKTGKQLWFCSNKCEKNMLKLKRKPRETKWTKDFEKQKTSTSKKTTKKKKK